MTFSNTRKPDQDRLLNTHIVSFELLAAQAAQLGFDEAVLILNNSKSGDSKLVRFTPMSAGRAAALVGEAERMLLDRIVSTNPGPEQLANFAASRRKGVS